MLIFGKNEQEYTDQNESIIPRNDYSSQKENYTFDFVDDTDIEQSRNNTTENINFDLPPENQFAVQSADQLDFGLAESKIKKVNQFQTQLKKWERIVEVLPYWKQPLNPINYTLAFSTIIAIGAVIITLFAMVDDKIILFYSPVQESHTVVDKLQLIILPIILFSAEILLLRVEKIIFNFDRRLSNTISLTQIFTNVLLIIAILQVTILSIS